VAPTVFATAEYLVSHYALFAKNQQLKNRLKITESIEESIAFRKKQTRKTHPKMVPSHKSCVGLVKKNE